MKATDRIVVAAIVFMYVAIPLYGTFVVLDPLRPPIPPLIPLPGVIGIGVTMLLAAAICTWGAVRRPAPRRLVAAQIGAGAAIVPAALLGFDPPTGLLLALVVLALGTSGLAVYGYAPLPGVTKTIVAWNIGAGLVASLVALTMVAFRTPAALFAYNNGRAIGTFLNPNELAAYLLMIVALAGGTIVASRGALRSFAALTVVVGLCALALTFSRWGFLAAAVGLAYFAVLWRQRRTWIGLGVAVVLALAVAAGPGISHHNPRDDTARLVAWTTGARVFLAFPLSGVGALAYNRVYDVLRPPEAPGGSVPVAYDPHSLPLAYLAESGLIGFGTLVFAWCVYIREIGATLRGAGQARRAIVYAFAAGLVAVNVHVLVNTISIYFALMLLGAALALALAGRDLDAPAA